MMGHGGNAWCASCRDASGVPVARGPHWPPPQAPRWGSVGPGQRVEVEKHQQAVQINWHHPGPCCTHTWRSLAQPQGFFHTQAASLRSPVGFHTQCATQIRDSPQICLPFNLDSSYCGKKPH
uniref:Uncharacterized protein n=1 Tax=Theropithecus gelada TaxID=9565 RepID=A0A8D2G1J2_THEGE